MNIVPAIICTMAAALSHNPQALPVEKQLDDAVGVRVEQSIDERSQDLSTTKSDANQNQDFNDNMRRANPPIRQPRSAHMDAQNDQPQRVPNRPSTKPAARNRNSMMQDDNQSNPLPNSSQTRRDSIMQDDNQSNPLPNSSQTRRDNLTRDDSDQNHNYDHRNRQSNHNRSRNRGFGQTRKLPSDQSQDSFQDQSTTMQNPQIRAFSTQSSADERYNELKARLDEQYARMFELKAELDQTHSEQFAKWEEYNCLRQSYEYNLKRVIADWVVSQSL